MCNKLSLHQKGFTILESLLMLVLLVVFCFVLIGVYKKGITKSTEAEDPAWLNKGGDESMKTVNPLPADKLVPEFQQEQPGLGGAPNGKDSINEDDFSKSK